MNGNDLSSIRGKAGEDAVCDHLEKIGYKVIKRNYRIRGGEIDIIAADDETVAFVEVKTRKFGSLTEGWEALTAVKKRRIIITAERFLAENDCELQPRFDVAYVTVTTDKFPQVLDLDYFISDFDATGVYR